MPFDKLIFRLHAVRRMFEREITEGEVNEVVKVGKIIENYPTDKPYPSVLILGWRGSKPLHVVVADNLDDKETIVITVYEPDEKQWKNNFTERKI